MKQPSEHNLATPLQGERQAAAAATLEYDEIDEGPGNERVTERELRRDLKPRAAAKTPALDDSRPRKITRTTTSRELPNPQKIPSHALASSSFVELAGPQAKVTCLAGSSAIEDAAALIRTVRSDRRLSRAAELLNANRRDPKVKKLRVQLFAAASDVLVQLYCDLLRSEEDAGEVLRRAARRQQPTSLFVLSSTPRSPIEEAISALSDLLAETKDPCHPSVKSERQLGIFRRPYDAMPLFFPNGRLRADGTCFPDVDRLAWEWLPLTIFTLTNVDGEEYEETAPATDNHGNVSARNFFLWRGSALSTAYKLGERKVPTAKGRETKKHASVPGLHEADKQLFVHIPTYLAERVERKATHWSREAAELSRVASGNSCAPVLTSVPTTRTEKFLLQLESEGANAALLREEWSEQIEEERRLGIYN